MRIGVISDSHDRLPALRRALEVLGQAGVGAILHAGDYVAPFAAKLLAGVRVPVHCVYGNNDGERRGLKEVLPQIQDGPLRLELGGRTIVVVHSSESLAPEHMAGADVVIAGHTHRIVNESREGRLWLNPGECCGWLTGRCTAAVLDADAMAAEIVEIRL